MPAPGSQNSKKQALLNPQPEVESAAHAAFKSLGCDRWRYELPLHAGVVTGMRPFKMPVKTVAPITPKRPSGHRRHPRGKERAPVPCSTLRCKKGARDPSVRGTPSIPAPSRAGIAVWIAPHQPCAHSMNLRDGEKHRRSGSSVLFFDCDFEAELFPVFHMPTTWMRFPTLAS